jgi:GAF domain-containing protein
LLLVNVGIALMIVMMAYSVAFFGALPPDRVVKHNLIHYLLRGPITAIIVIAIVQALPEQQRILGLPRDLIFATSIVAVIIIWQLLINWAKPVIDGLFSYRDRVEIAWISELDRRLLTTTDLQQALENVLTTLCETLRVRHGFIYNLVARQGPRLETRVGSPEVIELALASIDVPALTQQISDQPGYHFEIQNGFWFVILQNKARERSLGLLGIEARSARYDLSADEEETVAFLIQQAELALEDRRLQQEVFMALKNIIPEIERVQRLRSAVRYTGSPSLSVLTEENPSAEMDFTQLVRDALTHYWGGPKLTSSPLLGLQVVQEALTEHEGNAVKALRAVLTQAIERQRPSGERRMTATEWLIYNILDLKFVQGMRVRDVAHRLAMSEADLYRKQKLAIEEVSRTLSEMEAQRTPHTAQPNTPQLQPELMGQTER